MIPILLGSLAHSPVMGSEVCHVAGAVDIFTIDPDLLMLYT